MANGDELYFEHVLFTIYIKLFVIWRKVKRWKMCLKEIISLIFSFLFLQALKGVKSRQKGVSVITTVGGNLKCKFVYTVVLQPWTDMMAQKVKRSHIRAMRVFWITYACFE